MLRTENELAVISIGSDDGLGIGAKIEFVRNDIVIGQGTVIRTEFNLALCRCDGNLTVAGDESWFFAPK